MVLWAFVALWGVPWLITLAYEERGPQVLQGLISGRGEHPVDHYLGLWRGVARRGSILLFGGALAGIVAYRLRRQIDGMARPLFGPLAVLRDRDVLVLGLFFGVIGGVAEATAQVVRHWVFHHVSNLVVSGEVFWMAPLSASVSMTVIALVLIVVRRVVGSENPLRGVAPFVFAYLALWALGRTSELGIHPAALLVLAVGVATQVTRTAAARPRPFVRRIGQATAVLCVGLVAWGVLWPSVRDVLRRPDAGQTANAAPASAPNILVLLWDTVRARSLSLYGYHRPTTPTLDRLGAEGVVFEAAISTAPWTLPAHASLFTGKYHHELSVERQFPLDDAERTLAEAFTDLGYRTGGFVANNYWLGQGYGLGRGFEHYVDRPHASVSSILLSTWWSRTTYARATSMLGRTLRGVRINADQINGSFLRWVDQPDERPFFAFLNMLDAHEPYLPPAGVGFEFHDGTPLHTWDYTQPVLHTPAQLSDLVDAYDSCIHYLDDRLGRLVEGLAARGLADNTIIVVTSDHGESLGEHGADILGHENNVFYDVLQIPLVFHLPERLRSGVRVPEPTSLVDVPSTLLELAGAPHEAGFGSGRSFARLLVPGGDTVTGGPVSPALSQANPSPYHSPEYTSWPISKGPLLSLVQGEDHYVVNASAEEKLFRPARDPWEAQDLSGSPEGRSRLPEIRDLVRSLVPQLGSGPDGIPRIDAPLRPAPLEGPDGRHDR